VNTKFVTVVCFALCGLTAGIAGVLLAGYSQKAYQAWAMPTCCLPCAVVIAETTSSAGGVATRNAHRRDPIVLLNSLLSIMDSPRPGAR